MRLYRKRKLTLSTSNQELTDQTASNRYWFPETAKNHRLPVFLIGEAEGFSRINESNHRVCEQSVLEEQRPAWGRPNRKCQSFLV